MGDKKEIRPCFRTFTLAEGRTGNGHGLNVCRKVNGSAFNPPKSHYPGRPQNLGSMRNPAFGKTNGMVRDT